MLVFIYSSFYSDILFDLFKSLQLQQHVHTHTHGLNCYYFVLLAKLNKAILSSNTINQTWWQQQYVLRFYLQEKLKSLFASRTKKNTHIHEENPFWSAKHLRLGQDWLRRKGQFINMMDFQSFNTGGLQCWSELLETKWKSLQLFAALSINKSTNKRMSP